MRRKIIALSIGPLIALLFTTGCITAGAAETSSLTQPTTSTVLIEVGKWNTPRGDNYEVMFDLILQLERAVGVNSYDVRYTSGTLKGTVTLSEPAFVSLRVAPSPQLILEVKKLWKPEKHEQK